MLIRISLLVLLICSLRLGSQTYIYTLKGDTINIKTSDKCVLIFYTNKSCLDCFTHVNDLFKKDIDFNYYFVIEKTSSPILNYEIYKKLVARGVDSMKIGFVLEYSGEISPFLKIISKNKECKIPYSELFSDKKEMSISKKILQDIRNF